jgi:phosphatidylserine/phosphatidylglycerophosphate/cardiolipin synthase-like enzyme
MPVGLPSFLEGAAAMRAIVPDDGRATAFHAKVLIADQDLAYVGSANMTVFARHSMELGILVDGRAARVIANVIRGIEKISIPLVAR